LTRETEGRALDNPEASFLVREQRQTVRKALEQLSPGDQEVLIRCHQEPNSLETIAEEMGVSYAALRKRKSRALERLRNAMEGVTKPT
ncbi:MAG: sigma-70 family RNA polymerase sigma factor, partial [bacterium]